MNIEFVETILTILFENGDKTTLYYDPEDDLYFFNLDFLNLKIYEDIYLDNFLEKIMEIRKLLNIPDIKERIEIITYINTKDREVSSDEIILDRILDVSLDYIRDNYSNMVISYQKEPFPF